MENLISIEELNAEVHDAALLYPKANVVSIGVGSKNNSWYYVIHLMHRGKEIRYEIPVNSGVK